MTIRICTQCKKEYSLEFFNKNSGNPEGRTRRCKFCLAEDQKRIRENRSQEEAKALRTRYSDNMYKKNLINEQILYSEEALKELRICSGCRLKLPLSKFTKSLKHHKGFMYFCIECHNKNTKTHYHSDVEYSRRKNREKPYVTSGKAKEDARNSYAKNKDKMNEKARSKYQKDPESANAKARVYQLRKVKAVPIWANLHMIKTIYKYCKDWTMITGIKQSVDHIIPIRNKRVSGLHVEWNLQIMPWKENLSKGNKFNPNSYIHTFPNETIVIGSTILVLNKDN